MGIHERLLYVIQQEKLSAKDFADIIGVQRSSISHLLSGRNKPSIDFMEKFMDKFPDYNPVWFISGKGDVKALKEQKSPDKEVVSSLKSANKIVQHSIFEQPEVPTGNQKHKKDEDRGNETVTYVNILNTEPKTEMLIEDRVSEQPGEPVKREIERIVLFFEDGTFETYSEKKKK